MNTIRLVFLLTILVSSSFPVGAQSPERIFYHSFRPEGWNIYLSRDEGQTFSAFTRHPALDYDAVISPDGQWVVFTSERDGHPSLYIKDIEGKALARRLIRSESMQDQVAISPDGQWLVFVSTHQGNADIYRLPFRPDTTLSIRQAENLTRHPGGDFRPAFSPNGARIAFSSDRSHGISSHPVFPFARLRTGDIFVMDTLGNHLARLTDSERWDGSPRWSANGEKIIFYSERSGMASLFEMREDGTEQSRLFPFENSAVSPSILPNGDIAFTSWDSNSGGEMDYNSKHFTLMRYSPTSHRIDTLYHAELDMFSIRSHPKGHMVFHGGVKPPVRDYNRDTFFTGELLTAPPYSTTLKGENLEFYGIRRDAIAAPDPLGPHLAYGVLKAKSIPDAITVWTYLLWLFPAFVLGLFLMGLVRGIKDRKIVPFWRYGMFLVLAPAVGAILWGVFIFLFVNQGLPIITIRIIFALVFLVCTLIAVRFHLQRKKRKRESNVYLNKLYTFLFGGAAVITVYVVIFLNSFLDFRIDFLKVNYQTKELTHLFTFHKEPHVNPVNTQIIESKFSPDGQRLIFTSTNFGSNAKRQGDVWAYNFTAEQLTKLSNSNYNDGFGALSADGQKSVFRSGRTGSFDIYLQEGEAITNLTEDPHRDNFPAISARGDKIVYASDKEGGGSERKTMDLYLLELEEEDRWSEPRQLTSVKGQEAHPSFSPDGEWIIYATEMFGISDEQPLIQPYVFAPQMYGEVVAMHLRSGETIRLTHNKWEDGAPLWLEGY